MCRKGQIFNKDMVQKRTHYREGHFTEKDQTTDYGIVKKRTYRTGHSHKGQITDNDKVQKRTNYKNNTMKKWTTHSKEYCTEVKDRKEQGAVLNVVQ